jgi:hypothetical protein
VRVYNRALSQAEILADMNTPVGNATVPVSGPGDVNSDLVVDLLDLVLVANNIGKVIFLPAADQNGDGTVNLFDVMVVVQNWGNTY